MSLWKDLIWTLNLTTYYATEKKYDSRYKRVKLNRRKINKNVLSEVQIGYFSFRQEVDLGVFTTKQNTARKAWKYYFSLLLNICKPNLYMGLRLITFKLQTYRF